MTTEWPRPLYPNDYLTGAYLTYGMTPWDVQAANFGVPVAQYTAEPLSIVPGTFYQIEQLGVFTITATVPGAGYGSPDFVYTYLTFKVYDQDDSLQMTLQFADTTTTFSSDVTPTGNQDTTRTFPGFWYADPLVVSVGWYGTLEVITAADDHNGSPESQYTVEPGYGGVLIGIRGVGDDSHIPNVTT